jgi:flagellar hook-length control protein FliK
MEAAMVASDRSVGAALESAAPQLAAALRHRGIELASISVQHDTNLDLSHGHWNRGHTYASDSDRRHANNLSLAEQSFPAPAPTVQRPKLGSITELDVLV